MLMPLYADAPCNMAIVSAWCILRAAFTSGVLCFRIICDSLPRFLMAPKRDISYFANYTRPAKVRLGFHTQLLLCSVGSFQE